MKAFRVRSGTTLVELIVTLVVLGIFAAGLTRLMTSQSRFLNNAEGLSEARRVARSGVNLLAGDLRSVESSAGVVSASPTSMTLRVPWWIGISCGDGGLGAATQVVMPPVDSLLYVWGNMGLSGDAYVDGGGTPHYREPAGSIGAGTLAICTAESIEQIPGGRVISISPAIAGANPGLPVFLFQRITYSLATSFDYPPSLGLFRTVVATNGIEEVASPFDPSAQFGYYVAGSTAPVSNPAMGTAVFGVDLSLIGLNRRNTTGGQTQQAPIESAIYFKNR
jgi:prepilin-type N-terminal cleavage/methylation domain-containing protein